MEEVTFSISWGGTIEVPTWRMAVERTDWPDDGPFVLDVWAGTGPVLTAADVTFVADAVRRHIRTTIASNFAIQPELPFTVTLEGHRRWSDDTAPFD